jgi:outer membrane protein
VRARVLVALAVLVVVSGRSVEAQPEPAALALSLDAAVARALERSEEVRAARAQRALAESQIVQTRAQALPQVSANVGYSRTLASIFDRVAFQFPVDGNGNGNGSDPGLGDLPFGQRNIWTSALTISQPLYAGGAVRAAQEVAERVRRAADLEVREVESEIELRVRQAYVQMVLGDELLRIAEEARGLADAQVQQVALFRAQGVASDFDVLRAEVDRDNLQPPIVAARNARRVAELTLKQLINVPAGQPIVPTTGLDPILLEVDRGALRAAVEQRSALRALDEVAAAREEAVRVARAAGRPSVSTNATFGFQSFGVTPFEDVRRDWSVGVQLSVPLFDGGRVRGQVEQAIVERELVGLQRAQTREALDVELEASLGEFDAARAEIDARRATAGQARRALELVELRFRNGLATQLDVSDARLLLQQAQVNEVQAFAAYVSTIARIERVTGGGIPLMGMRLAGGE